MGNIKQISVNNNSLGISIYGTLASIQSEPLLLTQVHIGDIVTIKFDSYEIIDDTKLANIGFAINGTGWSGDTIIDNSDVVNYFTNEKMKTMQYHISKEGSFYALLFIYNCCKVNFYWYVQPNSVPFMSPFSISESFPITIQFNGQETLYKLENISFRGYVKICGQCNKRLKFESNSRALYRCTLDSDNFVIYTNFFNEENRNIFIKTYNISEWTNSDTLTIKSIEFSDSNYTDIVYLDNKINSFKKVYDEYNETVFGQDIYFGNLMGKFQRQYYEKLSIEDSAQTFATYIKYIKLLTSNVDENISNHIFKFYVGLLDQRSIFVERYNFNLKVEPNNVNNINVIDYHYDMQPGEILVVDTLSIDRNDVILYKTRTSDETYAKQFLYGPNNSLVPLATTYGGIVYFDWTTVQIDTIFAYKSDLANLQNAINENTQQINKQKYVYDSDGNAYKQIVVNGQLEIKPVNYRNVLCLGNSLTSHGYKEDIGYYGDDAWAMSSTNKIETTWSRRLETILKQKYSQASATPLNIYSWEVDPMNCNFNTIFEDVSSNSYDLIIFRAGENSGSSLESVYEDGFIRLINYLKQTFPLADIFVTSLFWKVNWKDTTFKNVAESMNLMYLDFGDISDRCLLGQMLMGRDNIMHTIIHSGVVGHCTDICFANYANALAMYLGYEQLSIIHTVTVNSSVDYNINNTYQTYESYVSILTYNQNSPNITVTDSNSNNIPVTHYNLSGTTWLATPNPIPTYSSVFLMPNTNVTVTIS